MSVQRWKPSWAQGRMIPAGVHPVDGYVSAADHARIVAEATAEARAAERRHWEARFRNAEQAHAAALAAVERLPGHTAHAYIETSDWSGGQSAQVRFQQSEQGRWVDKGDVLTLLGNAAAAPRTLTADDPEPAVTSVGLDRDQSVWQRVGSTEHSRWVNPFMGTREWSDVLARGPVRLLHDGEDR